MAEIAHPTTIARLIGRFGVQRHGVNQFLASRNIPRHIQANWFALFVKAILSLRYGWRRCGSPYHQGAGAQIISMCLIMRCTPNSALVDRVDFATPPFAVLSIGFRPLGSCPRAAGWSAATLCFGPSRLNPRIPIRVRFRGEAEVRAASGIRPRRCPSSDRGLYTFLRHPAAAYPRSHTVTDAGARSIGCVDSPRSRSRCRS